MMSREVDDTSLGCCEFSRRQNRGCYALERERPASLRTQAHFCFLTCSGTSCRFEIQCASCNDYPLAKCPLERNADTRCILVTIRRCARRSSVRDYANSDGLVTSSRKIARVDVIPRLSPPPTPRGCTRMKRRSAA